MKTFTTLPIVQKRLRYRHVLPTTLGSQTLKFWIINWVVGSSLLSNLFPEIAGKLQLQCSGDTCSKVCMTFQKEYWPVWVPSWLLWEWANYFLSGPNRNKRDREGGRDSYRDARCLKVLCDKFLLLYRYIYKLRTTEITENGS